MPAHNGSQTFSVMISQWKHMPHKNEPYVEYQLEISFKEGEGSKWTVMKRYSDFMELSDSIQKIVLQ